MMSVAMTILWVLLAAILIGAPGSIFFYWMRLRRLRLRARSNEICAWVGTLLRDYAQGSVLVADATGGNGFLQFALLERRAKYRVIEFGMPEADWARGAFPQLQALLAARDVKFVIEDTGRTSGVPRFLRAQIHGTPAEVQTLASRLIPDIVAILGYPVRQTFAVRLLGGEAPEYREELARQLERLPQKTGYYKSLAKIVRRRRSG